MPNVLICSYLEPEHVDAIAAVDDAVQVTYRPDLIPAPRYPADHIGAPFERTPEQAEAWTALMREAEVLFDFDYTDPRLLLREGGNVRWVQATSAGIGRFVERYDLHGSGAILTTAAGVHARPLAEFVLWGMLSFAKGYPQARRQQRAHVWERFVGAEIHGSTLAVIGLGSIGREVARQARALGARVVGTKRTVDGVDPNELNVDEVRPWTETKAMLAEADYVCLVAPHTAETEGMFDDAMFAAMKPGSVLINIGRGALVDDDAMRRALDDGPLAGAVLDVAPIEPLPADHPLWDRDDVILFPHSASTSLRENERLTDLFVRNLRAFLDDRPMTNVYQHDRLY
ncbi:MAG: D-2-hydroxyacid dehydrogenase [Trueperaceae bacterium]